MPDIKVVISVTKKEFEALSFFRHEVTDKIESAEDEKYLASINRCCEHYKSLTQRLFDSKSKKIEVSEEEFKALRELRDEISGNLESTSDASYIADFVKHDKNFSRFGQKYHDAHKKATVDWALSMAKKQNMKQT